MNAGSKAVAKLPETVSLCMQRQSLRLRMHAQRELIDHQLGPDAVANTAYPRSTTMRLLTQQPALTSSLMTGLASLLIGVRLFRTLGTALAVVNMLRAAAGPRRPANTQHTDRIRTATH